jgi:hypothetical protein
MLTRSTMRSSPCARHRTFARERGAKRSGDSQAAGAPYLKQHPESRIQKPEEKHFQPFILAPEFWIPDAAFY